MCRIKNNFVPFRKKSCC